MIERISRGGFVARAGGLLGAAAGLGAWRLGSRASAASTITCVLTPEMTEGPYYVSGEKVRSNITEGRPGVPLGLALTVVDASTCKPIKGAAVDIWHCDALGVYSGVQGDNGTFMRGVQRTNAHGSPGSRRSIPAGTPAAPCTST